MARLFFFICAFFILWGFIGWIFGLGIIVLLLVTLSMIPTMIAARHIEARAPKLTPPRMEVMRPDRRPSLSRELGNRVLNRFIPFRREARDLAMIRRHLK